MTKALTIGFFDGVHLGHQALFRHLRTLGHATCITFENHPQEILSTPPPLLTPHPTRFARIRPHVDELHTLPFTRELADLSAREFLHRLQQTHPFTHLLLGHDGRLGKGREGTPELIRQIGKEEGFEVEYLEPLVVVPVNSFHVDAQILRESEDWRTKATSSGWRVRSQSSHTKDADASGTNLRERPLGGKTPVSSGRIRSAIRAGDLEEARALLGYPYTITSQVIPGPKEGRKIGFPTANLDPGAQVLPLFGVYAITATHASKTYKGVANLGVAPTLHRDRKALLEVHLFNADGDFYGEELAVSLHTFIRPEQTFDSVEALKAQITQDVEVATTSLNKSHAP